MKIFNESYTVHTTSKNLNGIVSDTGNIKAITSTGREVWFPKDATQDRVITFKIHEKGDTFVALADSKTLNEEGLPIFSKGDNVTRAKESCEFIGFTHDMPLAPADTSTLEEKFALMAKYGISPKING
jgi:hypothetical protein